MAKKQYLSPEVEVNTLSCEDVLTSSGEKPFSGLAKTEVDGDTMVGFFNTQWFSNN